MIRVQSPDEPGRRALPKTRIDVHESNFIASVNEPTRSPPLRQQCEAGRRALESMPGFSWIYLTRNELVLLISLTPEGAEGERVT